MGFLCSSLSPEVSSGNDKNNLSLQQRDPGDQGSAFPPSPPLKGEQGSASQTGGLQLTSLRSTVLNVNHLGHP